MVLRFTLAGQYEHKCFLAAQWLIIAKLSPARTNRFYRPLIFCRTVNLFDDKLGECRSVEFTYSIAVGPKPKFSFFILINCIYCITC